MEIPKCIYFQELVGYVNGKEHPMTYCKASTEIGVRCKGMQATCEFPIFFNSPNTLADILKAEAQTYIGESDHVGLKAHISKVGDY